MKELKKLLEQKDKQKIWEKYCGFLDLTMEQYMEIQKTLMEEQIRLCGTSGIGKRFFGDRIPASVDEFRKRVPLTQYEDYADVLLKEDSTMLPRQPKLWIQTTWEGGLRPIKKAPYNREMLDVFRDRATACMLLSTGKARAEFTSENQDKMLYGLAPLPFVTGMLPAMINESLDVEILPPVEDAVVMSFSERNKKGFELAMKKGVDYFFGLGSVAYKVSKSLASIAGNPDLKPKHLFTLKGFLVAGTDNWCYKDDLEELWGIRPMELFAGTEPSVVGTEIWSRNGMYFFPDTCFYEFIRKKDMYYGMSHPDYVPPTCLMNEVVPGEEYELVISVLHGGAFVRYRIGDMFRCVGIGEEEEGIVLPRFEYADRRPEVIDLAGFTRITEREMEKVMQGTGLSLTRWSITKDFAENRHPFLHLFAEPAEGAAYTETDIKQEVDISFRQVDADYADLKQLLEMDPLQVTVLPTGTFANYREQYGEEFPKFHPEKELLKRLV